MGGWPTSIRAYCSTSETAAPTRSPMGTGWLIRLARPLPESTSRLSLLRRIRVARWSSSNRLASWSGSCSSRSSRSIRDSWRSTRTWLRRARLTKIALTLSRNTACSAASRTAWPCTTSNERATSPISSAVNTGTGSTASSDALIGSGSARMRWTEAGSRCRAMSRAPVRSRCSVRTSERATSSATRKAITSPRSTSRPTRNAWPMALEAAAPIAAVSWLYMFCSAWCSSAAVASPAACTSPGATPSGWPAPSGSRPGAAGSRRRPRRDR